VVLASAAVAAFGDEVLIRAQDPQVQLPVAITQVDSRFINLGPIEVTSELVGPVFVAAVPALSSWGLIVLALLLVALGLVFVRRRQFLAAAAPGE